jgi:hypothetical protein
LLHCTIALEQAKCFAGKGTKFYNPNKPKGIKAEDEATLEIIQDIYHKYNHASHNELERLFHCAPNFPPNQFNMDLCLDSIQVINRIPKINQVKNPYESLVNKSFIEE